jgi:hypothetical protein
MTNSGLLTNIKNSMNTNDEILFRSVKMLDIGYVTILYFIIAYILGYYLDILFLNIYGNDYENKSKIYLTLEVLLQISMVGIFAYIGRNIIQLIPSPLNGIGGFDHKQLKELSSSAFLLVFIFFFQKNLIEKIHYIVDPSKES